MILSITAAGAGPIASTVCDPAAIWVRPASKTMYDTSPAARALASSSKSWTSFSTLTAIFACPR